MTTAQAVTVLLALLDADFQANAYSFNQATDFRLGVDECATILETLAAAGTLDLDERIDGVDYFSRA